MAFFVPDLSYRRNVLSKNFQNFSVYKIFRLFKEFLLNIYLHRKKGLLKFLNFEHGCDFCSKPAVQSSGPWLT